MLGVVETAQSITNTLPVILAAIGLQDRGTLLRLCLPQQSLRKRLLLLELSSRKLLQHQIHGDETKADIM